MNQSEFIDNVHKRLAQISIGASALRNQGATGLVETARDYLANSIRIEDFFEKIENEAEYKRFLNHHTEKLQELFPEGGQSWGAARKALNLFFRELVYNKFIAEEYRLPLELEQFNHKVRHLEIPLDKDVATEIWNKSKELPKWRSIKTLSLEVSERYQSKSLEIAQEEDTARIHLDLIYWRPKKPKPSN